MESINITSKIESQNEALIGVVKKEYKGFTLEFKMFGEMPIWRGTFGFLSNKDDKNNQSVFIAGKNIKGGLYDGESKLYFTDADILDSEKPNGQQGRFLRKAFITQEDLESYLKGRGDALQVCEIYKTAYGFSPMASTLSGISLVRNWKGEEGIYLCRRLEFPFSANDNLVPIKLIGPREEGLSSSHNYIKELAEKEIKTNFSLFENLPIEGYYDGVYLSDLVKAGKQ